MSLIKHNLISHHIEFPLFDLYSLLLLSSFVLFIFSSSSETFCESNQHSIKVVLQSHSNKVSSTLFVFWMSPILSTPLTLCHLKNIVLRRHASRVNKKRTLLYWWIVLFGRYERSWKKNIIITAIFV